MENHWLLLIIKKNLFYFEGDILDMMTNYKFNAKSIEHPKVKKLLWAFLEQMRYDVKHAGNGSNKFGKTM